jgi:hypothetical protein
MRLWQVRQHGDLFARTEPLWAVLTTPGKEGNRWAIVDSGRGTGQRLESCVYLARKP